MDKHVFDKESAMKNVMDSEEMLQEIINMFLNHNIDEQSIQILYDAVSGYDVATIYKSTHNLKSTSMYAGAERLSDAIIELLDFSRTKIADITKDSYQKIDLQWNTEISQRDLDNAINIVELKRTTEPVATIIKKGDHQLYERYLYHVASEILNLINNGKLEPVKPMMNRVLSEVSAYKAEVKSLVPQ